MRVPRRAQEKARIEIIPMIDVIFFLLVFFMISTLSMTTNRSLPVNLPTAASTQQGLQENIALTLTREGGIFLDKQPTVLPDLRRQVMAALATNPQLTVVINADGELHHSAVVDVIDELRLAGVSALAIAVKPDKKP
jgi:biopolymer transport protein ExbD